VDQFLDLGEQFLAVHFEFFAAKTIRHVFLLYAKTIT
jgi:hypothetical protein